MRGVYNRGGISPSSSSGGLQSPLKATSRSQPRYHLYCSEQNYLIFTPRTKLKQGSSPLPAELPPRLGFSSHAEGARQRFLSRIFSLYGKIRCVVREGIAPVLPKEVMAQKSLPRFEFGALGSGIVAAVLSAVYFCF